jgi:hypothetical protein
MPEEDVGRYERFEYTGVRVLKKNIIDKTIK